MVILAISSTGWLAISLRNGRTGMFWLYDTSSWQCLQTESMNNRGLVKFSPTGQFFACDGQNKQLNLYIRTNFEETMSWWELQRIISMKDSSISSIELTDESLYIADMNGDIYQVDLSLNDRNTDLMITPENCIIKTKSMLLDMIAIRMNEQKSVFITAGQDSIIRLNHSQEICLRGHTEFVSHVKLIDNNYIISASGDGTIRLWRLSDCAPLMLFHSKAFDLLSKEVFYTELNYSKHSDQIAAISSQPHLPISSMIDYSIWKIDVTTYESDIFLAFSIYAYRSHSIYLTNLSNLKQLSNKQRKLTLDTSYGTIVDYCFANHDWDLYILFNSNVLLKVDIMSILAYDQTEYFGQPDGMIQEINNILTQKEFHLMNCNNNYFISDEINFKRLFKCEVTSSSCKRKVESTENEENKKQTSPNNEENHRTTCDDFF